MDTHLALRRDVMGHSLTLPGDAPPEAGHGPLGHTDYQRYVWERLREIGVCVRAHK